MQGVHDAIEDDAAREDEYRRFLRGGTAGMGDLALRGAAQHAQVIGDREAERALDDALELRQSV